jgi:hypothetical protein
MEYTVEVRSASGEVIYAWIGYADNEYDALHLASLTYEVSDETRGDD